MDYSYHNHTCMCSHATGTLREYVDKAFSKGIRYFGFSEHFPLKFSNGTESAYRLQTKDVQKYVDEVNKLKSEYTGKIDIKIGFEMEYYEELFDEMLDNAIAYGAEYLIYGPHFLKPEIYPDGFYTLPPNSSREFLKEYTDTVVKAIKTKVFTYVAHPDIIGFFGNDELFKKEFRKICTASLKNSVPLEINFLGIRKKRAYPKELAFEVMADVGNPVTFGFDAHDAMSAYDEDSLSMAKDIVKRYSLNYIGKPDIISLKKLK